MSAQTNLATTLSEALTGIVNAIVGIVKGIADAVSANATTIGTVLVIGGLVGLVTYALFRYVPFARGIFERILRV